MRSAVAESTPSIERGARGGGGGDDTSGGGGGGEQRRGRGEQGETLEAPILPVAPRIEGEVDEGAGWWW
jgi:hypothetical protein